MIEKATHPRFSAMRRFFHGAALFLFCSVERKSGIDIVGGRVYNNNVRERT